MDKTSLHEKWLKRAKSNLVRATMSKVEDVFYEDLCYDAQQTAEKSIKALLTFYKIKFRFVHDIGELLFTLEQNNIRVPDEIKESVILTYYAVETRYPSPIEPVNEEEYKEAVKLAEKVYHWAEELISNQIRLI